MTLSRSRPTRGRLKTLAWSLQFAALIVVGSALLIGLAYGSMQAELTMLAIGGVLFLAGRWILARR